MIKKAVDSVSEQDFFTIMSGIAHELNTPLTTIRIASKNLEQLMRQVTTSDDAAYHTKQLNSHIQETINSLKQEAYYASQMMRFMADNTKALILDRLILEPISLAACISECLAYYPFKGMKQANYIVNEAQDADVCVLANHYWLKQVVNNLLSNAIYHIEKAGKGFIKLQTITNINKCQLIIEDSGAGISPEIIQHIFEPYSSTLPHHFGLGLAACQHIVALCGGTITCNSVEGNYTKFLITLSRAANR